MVDFNALAAPFDPTHVHWRVGRKSGNRGMVLAYIDARHVMDRLDAVCGPDGWQSEHWHNEGKTGCRIGIDIGDQDWVWKSDGAGDTQFEGDKGAFSDALKRAAVNWGIARYLYAIDAPWVDLDKHGNIANHERPKLAELLRKGSPKPPEPVWHGPLGKSALKKKMSALAEDLRRCSDENELAGILHAYRDVLEQSAKEATMRDWHEGALLSIANKRRELEKVTRLPGEAESFDHDLTMDNLK